MGFQKGYWPVFQRKTSWWKAWFASSAAILFCALFGVTGMYPNLLASSLDPAFSLNVTNAASSALTLKIMLGVALVMEDCQIFCVKGLLIVFLEKKNIKGGKA